MHDASPRTKWARAISLFVLSALVFGALPALPALADDISLAVNQWVADTDTGIVAYDLTLSGDVTTWCKSGNCPWKIEATFDDGSGPSGLPMLGNGTIYKGTQTFSRTITDPGRLLEETTHVRATTYAQSAWRPTAWIPVHDVYPGSHVELTVHDWTLDANTGQVTYDLLTQAGGLGGKGEPCDIDACYLRVEAGFDDGTTTTIKHTLNNPVPWWNDPHWYISTTTSATDVVLEEITHVRARIYDIGGASISTGWIAVDPYPAAYINLAVNEWTVDGATGEVTYSLHTEAGGLGRYGEPCDIDACYLRVEAGFDDGTTTTIKHTLNNPVPWWNDPHWYIATTTTGADAKLEEVTHVRAYVYDIDGASISTGWIALPDYPDPEVFLTVNRWELQSAVTDPGTGETTYTYTYDLSVDGTALGVAGGPCDLVTCGVRVRGELIDGSDVTLLDVLGSGSLPADTWGVDTQYTGTYVTTLPATHLEAFVLGPDTESSIVSGPSVVWGTGNFATDFADLLQVSKGLSVGAPLSEATMRALRNPNAQQIDELLLDAPCPNTLPGSTNDCQDLFAIKMAAGLSIATAIAVVYAEYKLVLQPILEEALGDNPSSPDPMPLPLPPTVVDSNDINIPETPATWHTTAEHGEVVDFYAGVAYYLSADVDWLADVACRWAIRTGDAQDYPIWYGMRTGSCASGGRFQPDARGRTQPADYGP